MKRKIIIVDFFLNRSPWKFTTDPTLVNIKAFSKKPIFYEQFQDIK